MTLNDIFIRNQELTAAKEKAMKEISVLEHELADLNARAESAAAAGDEDLYLDLTDAASRISRRIYVKKKVLEAPLENGITENDVSAAWKSYAAEYDKAYNRNYEKLKKAKQDLYAVYRDMIESQLVLLQTRAKVYDLIKPPASTYTTPDMRFPFKHLPVLPKKVLSGHEVAAPNISCYGISFQDLITPMLYADDVIDRGTAERWAAIINGSTDVLPEKGYKPKLDRHIDPLGLFIN